MTANITSKTKYNFSATIWQHVAPKGGWYFVSLPKDISQEIREHLKWQEEGWGRLKADAQINDVIWSTAIWFDTKHNTYLLPIKSDIRKKLQLEIDSVVDVTIGI